MVKVPVVTVLAHGSGGGIALNEVWQTVQRGWPVLTLEGSGGLAAEFKRRMAGELKGTGDKRGAQRSGGFQPRRTRRHR